MASADTPSLADIPAGVEYDAWRIPVLSYQEFRALSRGGELSAAQLRYLVGFALLAPSSHNTVPQRFRLSPAAHRIDVLVDRRAILPASDPTGRQALVSVGCSLANLELAAEAVGVGVEKRTRPVSPHELKPLRAGEDQAPYTHLLSLRLTEQAPAPNAEWLGWMRHHKVLRAEYDKSTRLPASLVARLESVFHDTCRDGTLRLHLLQDPSVLRALGKFQEQADRFFFENTQFTRELGQWLLPNDQAGSSLGMRGREFGFDDDFSQHVHLALQGQRTLLPDQVAGFARGGRMGVESSSALIVISVEQEYAEALVFAGRVAQRLSLEAQRDDFYTAYHASLTEVEWARQMVSVTVLSTQRKPVVIMRVGKPKRPEDLNRPHASRPALDSIIVD